MIYLLPGTHRQIGRLVFKVIQNGFCVRLRRIALEYGSIKPDILPSMKSTPHTKDLSFHIVKDLIYQMLDKSEPRTKKEMRKFSIELGVLLHFISDYFCHVHNNGIDESLRKHYLYERKLGKRLIRHNWAARYPDLWETPAEVYLSSAQELIEYIEGMHQGYLTRSQHISVDICFCLEVCTTVASTVVANRFISQVEKQSLLTG
jgi:hypothetical protein